MKKLLLSALTASFAIFASAQQSAPITYQQADASTLSPFSTEQSIAPNVASKGTGTGKDTLYFGTSLQFSGPYTSLFIDYAAPLDSGRFYGMNALNYKGFAQLYKYANIDVATPADTTYNILGLLARFTGTKSATSTKSAVFTVWKRDAVKYPVTGKTKFYLYGEPLAATVATKSVPFTSINTTGTTVAYFASPVTGVNYDIYAGYTMSYSWSALAGDTIGLSSTQTGGTNTYTLESGTNDTLVSARNFIQTSAGVWKSVVYDLNVGNGGDQVIYPIIKLVCPNCGLGLNAVVRNNLSFFGNYPNPAVSNTNIKIGLKNNADVVIEVIDMNGKTLNSIKQQGLAAGTHIINVATNNLPAGNYVYTIQTSEGDIMASQMTVIK